MILRKINAILALTSTLLLMDHAVFHAVWMLSRGAITKTESPLSFILCGFIAAHAVISILLAFLGHKGAENRKCNSYAKLNASTMIQRISGILLIVFTALHVGPLRPPKALLMVLQSLFFAIALLHVAVSTEKAFITLGIGNAKTIKTIGIIVKLVCAVTFIAAVVGFYLYAC